MADEIPRVFFSYSRADSAFALKLANDLRATGRQSWLDKHDIQTGARWDRSVEEGVRGCSVVVVILSPESVRSENVLDEVSFALDQGKRVVPVLYSACELPLRLRRLQYIDFGGDYADAFRKLCKALPGPATSFEPGHHVSRSVEPATRCEISGEEGWRHTGIELRKGDVVRVLYVAGTWRNPFTGEPVNPEHVEVGSQADDEPCFPVKISAVPMLALVAKIGETVLPVNALKEDLQGEGRLFLRSNICDEHLEYGGGRVEFEMQVYRRVE
jgi:TIR domain